MSANLDRLIQLAKKSGSTLIIHDEQKGDMVMMDLDSYEMMLDMQQDLNDCSCVHEELYDMSEGDMLDKINRDIAVWRSYREEEELEWKGDLLEEDLVENPLEDPFAEDYNHDPEWHKAGDVLINRHSSFVPNFADNTIPDYFVPNVPDIIEDNDEDDGYNVEDQMFGVDDSEDDFVYDSLGQESLGVKHKVPFVNHEESEITEEEDLDGDPVFFEEPV
ncbi:MAG: hypothetical protein A2493_03615 [Candidatus Magasanikbacteria bacterium RIFOXYC12_FULL_33_11]|uniref:Antitoxin n=1 Tax=Candidatus Magasanikbacteria bacterium RIFOXYC12_FULL_33_11 TaxID=1798701 RepID=A0A1F6NRI1_9BACT|nr:MAG: hypothetical protein A2493_03615 [Candidatus Magasanikbacteria bacterium RIFOXYC12_FULL_33_11]